KVVVSNSLQRADWNNTNIMSGDVVGQLRDRKAKAENNFYAFGSADLLKTLLPAGLVDEYRLGIAPLLLGRGNPLFKPMAQTIPLTLEKTQPLQNGGIVLYYEVGAP